MTKRKKDQKNQRRNFEESERFKNNKEIVNEDIEKTAKSVKSPEEAVINMEKLIKSNKCNTLWIPYQQRQIFEKFKTNKSFIDMVKEFEISKSIILFKISIVKFVNKYPRMKKSSLLFIF